MTTGFLCASMLIVVSFCVCMFCKYTNKIKNKITDCARRLFFNKLNFSSHRSKCTYTSQFYAACYSHRALKKAYSVGGAKLKHNIIWVQEKKRLGTSELTQHTVVGRKVK